jgi:diacylglycerol kinase (ATP)
VIFNPASGRGRGARRLEAYRVLLREHLPRAEIGITTRPGEERDLTERALEAGADVIVAVGGDGTWGNVADRVVASARPEVLFGVLPNGTGNDFGRNLGFDPADAREAVKVLAAGHARSVDVGRLETPSAPEHDPGRMEPRHFLNLVGFGFDVAVIDAAATARFLKGELLYKVTALQQLFSFPGVTIGVESDEGAARDGRHLMLTVSNGRYFGGGFPIAPDADPSDGKLHACRILDAPPLGRLHLFNLAEKGRHVASRRVEILDSERFRLTFDAPPRFEMDGDVRRSAERILDVRILPAALRVITPA